MSNEMTEEFLVDMLRSLEKQAIKVEAQLRLKMSKKPRYVTETPMPVALQKAQDGYGNVAFSETFLRPLERLLKAVLSVDNTVEIVIEPDMRERPAVILTKDNRRVRWILDWTGLPWPGCKIKAYTPSKEFPGRTDATIHYRAEDALNHLHDYLNDGYRITTNGMLPVAVDGIPPKDLSKFYGPLAYAKMRLVAFQKMIDEATLTDLKADSIVLGPDKDNE